MRRLVSLSLASLLCGSLLHATDLTLDGQITLHRAVGTSFTIELAGDNPGWFAFIAADQDPGPVTLFGQSVPIGFSPAYVLVASGVLDANGNFSVPVAIPNNPTLVGKAWSTAAVETDAITFTFANGALLVIEPDESRVHTELAGKSLGERPHFQYVRTFNEGDSIEIGVDPTLLKSAENRSADVYVVEAKDAAAWDLDSSLVDVSADGANTVSIGASGILDGTFVVDSGSLDGQDGDRIGVGYDLILDLDQDGQLSPGDFIDGYGDEPGFYVVHDLVQPGLHPVTEAIYNLGGSFASQDLYYPSDIASMGQLPLIVVSHGNGHNYQWYDHIGEHMASYGYIVMSHQNNTVPGIQSASTTTLTNTDSFLANLGTIEGGLLDGHVDSSRIVWIGHSRGGEGVCRAYDRIFDGSWNPSNYSIDDIVLISSIAPTDFLGTNSANPHGANYHLWVGGSDSDVTGCADTDIVQSFHLHDRAENQRQSISLHGAGHGHFHDGTGGNFATGPCLIGNANTHNIMRGYFLPLCEYHVFGNMAAKDFLTRQWEDLKPIGAPNGPCITVDLQFRDSTESGKLVIDDFQTNTGNLFGSSGSALSFTVTGYLEGRLDDGNSNFTDFPSGTFNGMTAGSSSDTTRGAIFSADGSGDFHLTYSLAASVANWEGYGFLSLRACQITRHPLTNAEDGDLTFSVRVTDASGNESTVNVGAFGGGVEEPYQRTGCGNGAGWGNEFETIRVPVAAFQEGMPELDIANLDTLAFWFGPSFGSNEARLGIDDIELTID